jgi:hypothetical protein
VATFASASVLRILNAVLPVAGVDVRGYCQTFMADGVPFFIDFHLAKGDEQVQLSPWRNHNMGRVRELQFVTQLKVLPDLCHEPQLRCLPHSLFSGLAGLRLLSGWDCEPISVTCCRPTKAPADLLVL